MGIVERIREDVKAAMRERNEFLRDTLRQVNGALKQAEIDERKSLSDADAEKILQKQVKRRIEAIEQYTIGKRDDLAEKERKEIAIIEQYLPKQLSDEELESELKAVIASLEQKTIGAVMSAAKTAIGSKADGKRISQAAKRLLDKDASDLRS
ncbi:MAG: GatB/YqeY domain-containing protein [Helicobacteraceae bacterium]|nr:GatB/YqeY domain-containing protein [Helicobacteraceae bacterium]